MRTKKPKSYTAAKTNIQAHLKVPSSLYNARSQATYISPVTPGEIYARTVSS